MSDAPHIDPYSTHLPLLIAACASIDDTSQATPTVIELGGGFYSTPILRALMLARGGRLVTFDSDREWLTTVYAPGDDRHAGHLVDWADLHRWGPDLTCDVAFVDAGPTGQERGMLIDVMRRWARVIVIHDTESEQAHSYPGVAEAIAKFTHRISDRRRGPQTTAVSDVVDVTTWGGLIA